MCGRSSIYHTYIVFLCFLLVFFICVQCVAEEDHWVTHLETILITLIIGEMDGQDVELLFHLLKLTSKQGWL